MIQHCRFYQTLGIMMQRLFSPCISVNRRDYKNRRRNHFKPACGDHLLLSLLFADPSQARILSKEHRAAEEPPIRLLVAVSLPSTSFTQHARGPRTWQCRSRPSSSFLSGIQFLCPVLTVNGAISFYRSVAVCSILLKEVEQQKCDFLRNFRKLWFRLKQKPIPFTF